MMRKAVSFIIICLSLFPLMSVTAEDSIVQNAKAVTSYEPLLVEFTSSKTVLVGFSRQKVTGTTMEGVEDISATETDGNISTADKTSDVGGKFFTYDSDNGYFYVNNIFYYAQVFTTTPARIIISGSPLKQSSDFSNPKILNWKSEPETKTGYYIDTATSTSIDIDESKMNVNFNYPRVYSDEIQIKVPFENIKDMTSGYSAELTIVVEAP